MRIVAVPCLADNYAYLVIDDASHRAAVVDPGEAAPVEAALARERVELAAIWATHHHLDHVGGVRALVAAPGRAGIDVIGHTSDLAGARIAGQTRGVDDGDIVELGAIRAHVLFNPGHTLGAISYWIAAARDDAGAVFTGDTLFAAGCGRVFEGTPPQMHASLAKLAALPPPTRVYFGHEYTAANLKFAVAVEPDNVAARDRAAAVATARAGGHYTTPSTIADELATNPFLRTAEPAVRAAAAARAEASAHDPAAVFAAIRAWKNEFK